ANRRVRRVEAANGKCGIWLTAQIDALPRKSISEDVGQSRAQQRGIAGGVALAVIQKLLLRRCIGKKLLGKSLVDIAKRAAPGERVAAIARDVVVELGYVDVLVGCDGGVKTEATEVKAVVEPLVDVIAMGIGLKNRSHCRIYADTRGIHILQVAGGK